MSVPALTSEPQAAWVREIGYPCFRPHVRRNKDGAVLYEVTAEDLAEIAENSATVTVELHGDKPPLTEGHRDFSPDAKESDQPLILGYIDNFRMGTLPDKARTPAILCDRHYMAQHAERAKRHPFPSVDYLPNRRAIVGLAKLTRPPALNTGGVYYPGTTEPVYVYAMGADMADPSAANPNAAQAAATAPDPNAEQPPALTPEEQAGCEKILAYMKANVPAFAKLLADFEAGNAVEPVKEPPVAEAKPATEAAEKYAADLRQRDAKSAAELKAARDRIAALEAARERDKVAALLTHLETVEHYQFDMSAETSRLLPLTDAQRLSRVAEIKQYHPKVEGTGDAIQVYRGDVEGPAKPTTQAESAKALKYQREKGCDYATALAAVKGAA